MVTEHNYHDEQQIGCTIGILDVDDISKEKNLQIYLTENWEQHGEVSGRNGREE